eukprot:603469-Prymnesium_polylepis.1
MHAAAGVAPTTERRVAMAWTHDETLHLVATHLTLVSRASRCDRIALPRLGGASVLGDVTDVFEAWA